MSQETVEIVRRSFEAIAQDDIEALLRLYHDDVEFLPLTGTQIESGGYRGHAGVRDYFDEAAHVWDAIRPYANDVRPAAIASSSWAAVPSEAGQARSKRTLRWRGW